MMSVLLAVALLLAALLLPLLAFWPRRSRQGAHPQVGRSRDRAQPAGRTVEARRRELEAERRAEELLRSVVGEDAWQAYRALGFLFAFGPGEEDGQPGYGYLIYPHRAMVSFDARSGVLLNELCVSFPDRIAALEEDGGGERLPDADDVLAKWMAIHGDELALLAEANVLPPGRQIDPDQARRDIARLGEWTARPSGNPAAS